MPKKQKKQKVPKPPPLPAPDEFAARHGIAVDTARAILNNTLSEGQRPSRLTQDKK
jgi:hypothetical protein